MPHPLTYSASQIGELLEVSSRRLQQLAAEGVIPKPAKRGRYDLAATVRGYVGFLRNRVTNTPGGELRDQQIRETKERADKLALENERRRGVLVESETVFKTYENVFIVFRSKVLASTMTDFEKEELLNELRGLKVRDFIE